MSLMIYIHCITVLLILRTQALCQGRKFSLVALVAAGFGGIVFAFVGGSGIIFGVYLRVLLAVEHCNLPAWTSRWNLNLELLQTRLYTKYNWQRVRNWPILFFGRLIKTLAVASVRSPLSRHMYSWRTCLRRHGNHLVFLDAFRHDCCGIHCLQRFYIPFTQE